MYSLTPSVRKGFIYKGHSSTSYPTGKDYLQYCTFLELSYYIFKEINHTAYDLRSKRAINYRLLCETAISEPLIITKENRLIQRQSLQAHSSEKPNAFPEPFLFFLLEGRTDYRSRFPGLNSRGCVFMIVGRPFYADLRLAMTGVWVIFSFGF